METNLRIAIAQINSTVGDLGGNSKKIVNFIKKAKALKSDMVTFPELAICGYPPEDLLLKGHFVKDNIEALNFIIREVANITAILGFVDIDNNGNLYNAAAIIQDRQLKGVYHKMELPNYGVFDEKRYFTPGHKPAIFTQNKLTFGVNICEDIWKAKNTANAQRMSGVDIIVNISASPYYAGKVAVRNKMLIERAHETGSYICYNNLVGGQDELVFDGSSLIIDPRGKTKCAAMQFEEDLLACDLHIKCAREDSANSKKYRCIKLKNFKYNRKPALPAREIKQLNSTAQTYNALVLGTKDYVAKNGFKKVIMGLSGGIDSSLTAAIACDAIGQDNVVGVSMPSRYSSNETQMDACALADNLKIKLITISINSIFDIYLRALQKEFFSLERDTTEENLQARIRGNLLMALSNKFGWLVLATGNKSEISVGYCTLYGDMAGGFSVIKDVLKTRVYELAAFVNKKSKKRLIPESVIEREPTAELKTGQRDQDSLPPYPVLDEILKEYVEEDKNFDQIISNTKFAPEVIKDIIKKVDSNEYKRRQASPGVKITPKAFGKDRRFPIVNLYREY